MMNREFRNGLENKVCHEAETIGIVLESQRLRKDELGPRKQSKGQSRSSCRARTGVLPRSVVFIKMI